MYISVRIRVPVALRIRAAREIEDRGLRLARVSGGDIAIHDPAPDKRMRSARDLPNSSRPYGMDLGQ